MAGSLKTYRSGMIAEMIAAMYLLCKGYKIIGWRTKTPMGEIDLIASARGTIIFIEVKTRKINDDAVYAANARNQGRVQRAALYLSAHNPRWAGMAMRFDVIAISLPFSIRHIDNAWRPQA